MKTLNDYVAANPVEFRQEELILEVTELIARIMKQNGVSKAELAARLKKSKAFVSQCLSGEQNLTLQTVANIFGALDYRMEAGAVPLAHSGKPSIPRLYPIGGWALEAPCKEHTSSCDLSSDDYIVDLQGAAA